MLTVNDLELPTDGKARSRTQGGSTAVTLVPRAIVATLRTGHLTPDAPWRTVTLNEDGYGWTAAIPRHFATQAGVTNVHRLSVRVATDDADVPAMFVSGPPAETFELMEPPHRWDLQPDFTIIHTAPEGIRDFVFAMTLSGVPEWHCASCHTQVGYVEDTLRPVQFVRYLFGGITLRCEDCAADAPSDMP